MMRVLIITSEWPTTHNPSSGIFVRKQVEALRKLGIIVQVFAFRGRMNPFSYFRAWMRLRLEHNFKEYDLIHAHFGQSGLLAFPSPKPVVITFHGSDLQGFVDASGRFSFAGKMLSFLSRFVSRFAKYVILVSTNLAQYLPKGVPYQVIPGGVDLDLFRPGDLCMARDQLALPRDKKLILFASDPSNPIKRFYLARDAVDLLKKEDSSVALITLYGHEYHSVPVYMNASNVLLLTSKHEGSPTVLKEALACNLPIVSVQVGDADERLSGIDGCIVCRDDRPETICKAIKEVLLRDGRIEGRESILPIDDTLVGKKIISVYNEVLTHR